MPSPRLRGPSENTIGTSRPPPCAYPAASRQNLSRLICNARPIYSSRETLRSSYRTRNEESHRELGLRVRRVYGAERCRNRAAIVSPRWAPPSPMRAPAEPRHRSCEETEGAGRRLPKYPRTIAERAASSSVGAEAWRRTRRPARSTLLRRSVGEGNRPRPRDSISCISAPVGERPRGKRRF